MSSRDGTCWRIYKYWSSSGEILLCSCLKYPSGAEIRSVAVKMTDMLEQCKEVVEEMIRKVVEFLETNMGMVGENLEQVGDNLEEAWGNLVEEFFNGDDTAALQVIFPNPIHPSNLITLNTISIVDIMCKVVVGAILLLISVPYWVYHCFAGNAIQCKPSLLLECFPPQETASA